MKRFSIIILAVIFIIIITGCSKNQQQSPIEIEVTKLVEATRIVEVTREIVVTQNVEVTRLVLITPTINIPTITPTLSSIEAQDPRSSIFVNGNTSPNLVRGEPGKLSVILSGKYTGYSIPIIVRNNTPNDITRIKVAATAYAPDGKLIATGGSQKFNPNLVRPGEISMGYVYFGSDVNLPEDAKIEYDVSGNRTDSDDAKYENIRDLMVKDQNLIDKRIVGVLENPYDFEVNGPIEAVVTCFDENDQLTNYTGDYTDKDSAGPKEEIPFQVGIEPDKCSKYLVSASGFSEMGMPLYPDLSAIPTKDLQADETKEASIAPTLTPQPTAFQQATTAPTRTLIASEVDAIRQVFLATTLEYLAKLEDVGNVNLLRFKDDVALEIELKLKWASKDMQPIASYNAILMLSGAFCSKDGKQLLTRMNIMDPSIDITTYSSEGGYRYKSTTSFETLQKICNKTISYEEWVAEANAGFR